MIYCEKCMYHGITGNNNWCKVHGEETPLNGYCHHGSIKGRTITCKLDSGVVMPERKHPYDAGMDLCSRETVTMRSGVRHCFRTGVHVAIPEGYAGFVKGRSSLNRAGIIVPDGTIDTGYTGDIGVVLINVSGEDYTVHSGDRIAQLVITPVMLPGLEEGELLETDRGNGGFGSTGR